MMLIPNLDERNYFQGFRFRSTDITVIAFWIGVRAFDHFLMLTGFVVIYLYICMFGMPRGLNKGTVYSRINAWGVN